MTNYYSVDEISAEIGVSRTTLSKKVKEMGFDFAKITKAKKNKLIKAVQPTIDRKKKAKEFIDDVKQEEVGEIDEISSQSGSTLEKRLSIAKREFDNVTKSLKQCQKAIDLKGTILMNGNNGTISSNPAIKTKLELLKQHNALQKTISDLEQALRMTITPSSKDAIDDE